MSKVSIEEQNALGIRRQQYPSQPPPAARPTTEIEIRKAAPPPLNRFPDPVTALDVTPTATARIDMVTSAQDRAVGFLIASTPRTFVFALAITLLAILATGIGVVAGIVVLVSVFSVVELASYIFTLAISAEGTAHYEARQKWAILHYEQRQRWAHYNQRVREQKDQDHG